MAIAGPAHEALPMTGIADHWQLRQEVYIGALYLPSQPKTPEDILAMSGPRRMELRVTAEKFSPRQWSEMWNQQLIINNSGKDELQGLTDEVISFTSLLKDSLTNGDDVTIDYTPKVGVEIALNGTTLYRTRQERFFNVLLKAWIGPRPPSSEFKRNIVTLPQGDETQDLIDRYTVVLPDNKRKSEIAAWVKSPDAPKPEPPKPEPPKLVEKPKPALKPEAAPAPKPTQESKPAVVAIPPAPAAPAVSGPALPAPPAPKPAPPQKTAAAPSPVATPAKPAAQAAAAPAAPSNDTAKLEGLKNIYRANMLRLTYRHVVYPSSALAKGQEGSVMMKVTVNRSGKVTGINFEKSSEFSALDRAAEKAVKKASPFPEVSKDIPGEAFDFSIPIRFRIPR
jgi:periplasmic protein TonB